MLQFDAGHAAEIDVQQQTVGAGRSAGIEKCLRGGKHLGRVAVCVEQPLDADEHAAVVVHHGYGLRLSRHCVLRERWPDKAPARVARPDIWYPNVGTSRPANSSKAVKRLVGTDGNQLPGSRHCADDFLPYHAGAAGFIAQRCIAPRCNEAARSLSGRDRSQQLLAGIFTRRAGFFTGTLSAGIIPVRSAIMTSSATERTPHFSMTMWRWAFTVRSQVPISWAICLLSMPRTTSANTCFSRGVRVWMRASRPSTSSARARDRLA